MTEPATGPLVAVVDDDQSILRSVEQLLESADYRVRVFALGASLLESGCVSEIACVISDVDMPGMDGFELLRRLGDDERPRVVFVTAHGEHAIEAFDVDAIDYLLKPFDRRRFDDTIARVRRERRLAEDALVRQRMADLLERLRVEDARPRQFVVTVRGRMVFVDVADVQWITAQEKYVRLHTTNGSYLLREAIGSLEGRLDPREFMRVHRSTIVRIARVREMYRGPGDDYVIVLHDGTQLALSRRYRSRMRAL
jgi:two-component system, LytTR family, response regulator